MSFRQFGKSAALRICETHEPLTASDAEGLYQIWATLELNVGRGNIS
jgi:hypothetical protein